MIPVNACTSGKQTPAIAPIRRLSREEYQRSVEDLLGDAPLAAQAAAMLTPDPISLDFTNGVAFLDVKQGLAQDFADAAERIGDAVASSPTKYLPCNPTTAGELACATQFVASFVRKAFRGTAVQADLDRYLNAYKAIRTQGFDFAAGVEAVVMGVLQSPRFLYRMEFDAAGTTGVRKVSPLELASRLSFLLWHSGPDQALLDAATQGKLVSPQEVATQARRLLADPKSARVVDFFSQWLDLDEMNQVVRDAKFYPGLSSGLAGLFRTETETFVKYVMQNDGKLETLLAAPYTFANDALAKHYGLPAVTGAAFQKVPVPATKAGVLLQGGPLTLHDKSDRTSIVNRGLRVRTDVLCGLVNAPPNGVSTDLGPVDQGVTQAERLAEHRKLPACAGCHALMDPLGTTFERLDAVGRPRSVDEANRPVVSTGEITATPDINGKVAGPDELVSKLSTSDTVRQCFTTTYFRYAFGHEESDADACSRQQMYEKFKASGFDVRELLVAVTQSDDFLYRQVTAP